MKDSCLRVVRRPWTVGMGAVEDLRRGLGMSMFLRYKRKTRAHFFLRFSTKYSRFFFLLYFFAVPCLGFRTGLEIIGLNERHGLICPAESHDLVLNSVQPFQNGAIHWGAAGQPFCWAFVVLPCRIIVLPSTFLVIINELGSLLLVTSCFTAFLLLGYLRVPCSVQPSKLSNTLGSSRATHIVGAAHSFQPCFPLKV